MHGFKIIYLFHISDAKAFAIDIFFNTVLLRSYALHQTTILFRIFSTDGVLTIGFSNIDFDTHIHNDICKKVRKNILKSLQHCLFQT